VTTNLTYQASVARLDDMMRQAARERQAREAAPPGTFWGSALGRRARSRRRSRPPVSATPLHT
jgi:hypothetical protein